MPSKLPHLANAPDLTRQELFDELWAGARVRASPYVISLGGTRVDRTTPQLVRPGEPPAESRGAVATSLLFGWWGWPGIRTTTEVVQTCRSGGVDLTEGYFQSLAPLEVLRTGRSLSEVDTSGPPPRVEDPDAPALGPPRRPVLSIFLASMVIAVVVALALSIRLTDPDTATLDELEVDDCLALPDELERPIGRVELRFCDSTASSRVTAVVELDEGQRLLTETELTADLQDDCREVEELRPDQQLDVLVAGTDGSWGPTAWCVLSPP
ncbi:MAG: hypothetical protein AAGA99_03705 [Actinomycetota bacterium]